jgi:uncharacterized protein YjbI with pentapeptide repeats
MMRERFKQWRQTGKFTQKWGLGAIATSVVLAMVCWLWLLPDGNLQAEPNRLNSSEENPHTEPQPNSPAGGLAAIATIFGMVFLVNRVRKANDNKAKAADFRGADLNGANFCDASLSGADFNGASLCGTNFSGADLSKADLSGANLVEANLSGANLNGASLRFSDLKGADLRYTTLRNADLRNANLRGADLHCTFLSGANFSEANLSGALLFFVNLRGVLNLEPRQLKAKPSPFLCHAALPYYSQPITLNPNSACDRIPDLLSDRYDISLEEAQEIIHEARQYRWGDLPKD